MEPAERNQRDRPYEAQHGEQPGESAGIEQAARAGVARLVVAGVGGAGCNAVNRMIEAGVRGVEFVALNTDAQALALSRAPYRLRLGDALTRGLGAGGNPDLGRRAAEESDAAIRAALDGADMVFVTAGMGGGTGTGAAPLVARAARELGALAVAVVTTPFAFERRRRIVAQHGLAALREVVDALIVVPNERLMEMAERDLGLFEAYRRADDVLRQGVQGISDLVTIPGLINLDFADVRVVIADAGSALIATGRACGEDRAETAARQALTNPLLDVDIAGARGVIFNVTGGDDLTLREVEAIAGLIAEAAHPDADIIYGTVYDPTAAGTLSVAVVATGFEPRVRHERVTPQARRGDPPRPIPPPEAAPPHDAATSPDESPAAARPHDLPRQEPRGDYERANTFSITPIAPPIVPARGASPYPLDVAGGASITSARTRDERDERDEHQERRSSRDRPPRPVRVRMPGYHGDEFVSGDETETDAESAQPSARQGSPQPPHRRWEIFGRHL